MKQNLTPEDWGVFERENKNKANKFRKWLDNKDYPSSIRGCILYDTQPINIRITIGRLIEFLTEKTSKSKFRLWYGVTYPKNIPGIGAVGWNIEIENFSCGFGEPIDALFEAMKEITK